MVKIERTIIKRINQKIILPGWFAVMGLFSYTLPWLVFRTPTRKHSSARASQWQVLSE
jgi:hypothetical protein